MVNSTERDILEKLRRLEKRIEELEEKMKNRNETLIEEYLKTHGFN